ncbi:caspase family protein [Pseudorhodoplanes sinuspersici]|uniref:Uncharacterized protein n=1 Tax=Pseudorhodoplanes sinuspersici TaxID=1235591 RepID=A0A1W6ZYL4_9HYPH|nr:caspase family protein [Pseudorhodoplanes sinuspersici]ARQ02231.1 hypothetical protein CAK95_26380 [Pseudorhodoplanes sinuspersici]RKE74052.1 putative caspase-like protein [Pseudorhodoplanes sinuspersici]
MTNFKVQEFGCVIAAILFTLVALTQVATARTALVIGNGAYPKAALANPRNDASDIADALRNAGFDVDLRLDARRRDMQDAIARFGTRLKSKGGVGLFYFAGHGVQFGGENYLLPIDADITAAEDFQRVGISAAEAVDAMAKGRNELSIVILDACRDNPFPADGGTRGLSRIDSGSSLFVSFSTSPGAVALDGSGRNSPYTKHLVQAIGTPELSIEDTFKRTLKGVYTETKGEQTPWLSSSFFGDFIFRPAGPKTAALAPTPKASPLDSFEADAQKMPSLAGVYRSTGTYPDGTAYTGMTAITPAEDQLRFTWWVGGKVYEGFGRWAGRMLVVELSDNQRIVYTFPGGEKIEGEWADGTATDKLERAARAAARPMPSPQGRYNVVGKDRGNSYTGSLTITRDGGNFLFTWNVRGTVFRGTGTRDGNLITVDWGSATPIIYALTDDGYMIAIYAGGRSLEVARRK